MGAWIETDDAPQGAVGKAVAPLVGAWIETLNLFWKSSFSLVAPLVGAWIETTSINVILAISMSHPSWVRGLKHQNQYPYQRKNQVAPLVGAWIETDMMMF